MKKVLIAATFLAMASAAQAADVAASVWEGPFIGGSMTYAGIGVEAKRLYGQTPPNVHNYGYGYIAAVGAGTNYSFDRAILGVEADLGYAHLSNSKSYTLTGGTGQVDSSLNAYGSLRGRAGYAFGTGTLVFGTAGLALGRFEEKVSLPPNADNSTRTLFGVVLGVGVEQRLDEKWSVKGEYIGAGFKKTSGSNETVTGVGMLRFGVNMKL